MRLPLMLGMLEARADEVAGRPSLAGVGCTGWTPMSSSSVLPHGRRAANPCSTPPCVPQGDAAGGLSPTGSHGLDLFLWLGDNKQ